jgi:hypothetical protein
MSEFATLAIFPRLSPRGRAAILASMNTPAARSTLTISLSLMAMLAIASCVLSEGADAAPPAKRAVSLTQDPLVMRLNKDEFRIAFGINGERCEANGCSGIIRYRVEWKTQDGATRSEIKHVNYTVAPRTRRTIAVDRQYFDTAEGQHITDVVKVSIDAITCLDGAASGAESIARL